MILKKKTLIIVGATIIGLIIAIFVFSQFIVLESFNDLEEKNALENTQRVQDAFRNDIDYLDSMVLDWAVWDDSYEFIEDANEEYINSNLVDETFTGIELNLIMFINSSGTIIYGNAYDLTEDESVPVPHSMEEHISPNSLLLSHSETDSSISGIISLPEGPMLVASRPIVTSDFEGPIRGTLIFGRYLNSDIISQLSDVTHLSVAASLPDDPQIPADVGRAASSLSKDTPIVVQTLSEEFIAGYVLLNDIYGEPALILKIDMPRRIYQQGQTTMDYFIISIILTGLIFGIITIMLLERSVLSRLTHLSADVGSIEATGDHSGRISMTGDDELSNLAGDINTMLDALERSQDELIKSETKNRAILDAMPYLLFQIKKDGTIFNYKAANEEYLFVPPAEFMNKKIEDVMPEEITKQTKHHIEQALESGQTQVYRYNLTINGDNRDFEARFVVSGEDEILAIMNDITEYKKEEEARKNEILLKEVHHRVKNNLQVISSLLYLQSTYFDDEKMVAFFTESQNRVKSMALAHEKLYESKDQASIDFVDYIQNMTAFLLQSYRLDSLVKLQLHIEDVFLGIDTAIPCGLIVNELVSNSLKHAFPAGVEGEISITLSSDNDVFTLIISDNGAGFPDDIDFKNTESLGLQLVNNLVEQIDGTIELDSNDGTKFTISFKDLQYKERG